MRCKSCIFTVIVIANFFLCSLRQRHFTAITPLNLAHRFLSCSREIALSSRRPITNDQPPGWEAPFLQTECSSSLRCLDWIKHHRRPVLLSVAVRNEKPKQYHTDIDNLLVSNSQQVYAIYEKLPSSCLSLFIFLFVWSSKSLSELLILYFSTKGFVWFLITVDSFTDLL